MRVTHIDELARITDGAHVEVEGRYERWNPNLAPPGEIPVSARVVLAGGGGGILIGGYLDAESRRPDGELAHLSGAIVRVVGTYLATRPFPGPGPMPGLWTGGGPQLVNVQSIDLLEAPLVAVAAALFVVLRAAGNPLGTRVVGGVIFLGGCAAFFAVDQLMVRLLAGRELRRLKRLPFAFDLAAYVAALDGERGSSVLVVEVELASPAADSRIAPPGNATIAFSHPRALSIRCPQVATSWSSLLASRTYRDSARVHRWFRRCESVLAPLHAARGVRAIAAHLE